MGYPPRYGRPSDETARGLAVIALLAVGLVIGAVVTLVTVLDPPAPMRSASATGGAAHSEEEVRRSVQPVLDAYSSGSYGDFWDLWSTDAKGLISREDYIRLFQLCPQLTDDATSTGASPADPSAAGPSADPSSTGLPSGGAAFTIASVTVHGDDATVQAIRSGTATGFGFRFEEGSWRYAPSPEELEEYRTKTADQMAQERRGAGLCGAAVPDPAGPSSGPASGPSPDPADPSADPSSNPADPSSGPSSNGPSSDPAGPSPGPSSKGPFPDPADPSSGRTGPTSDPATSTPASGVTPDVFTPAPDPSSSPAGSVRDPERDPAAPSSDPTSAPPAQES
ncbi:hypothetical protein [Streptosporangium pseudovulgare]|uniref:EF-hand domain-containing protein n=1 Tax=Streptosporangium pseudovulgare TaxID=35765 RepID=A0ABQ2RGW5_9ACTN|nr:hypothetical protein [Streptosporangium pseudovulgare]GGQ27272.1 hypothetical protein GCM10010140_66780 [Streptosporangium pseudovulgare]